MSWKKVESSQLLPTVAAARELGVTHTTLNVWRRYGCPVHNIQRGSRVLVRYDLEDVRAWRAARAAALNATRRLGGIMSAKEKECCLLTNKELAARLRCGIDNIRTLQKEGMPCVFLGRVTCGSGSRPRYDWEQVKAWLERRGNPNRKEQSND